MKSDFRETEKEVQILRQRQRGAVGRRNKEEKKSSRRIGGSLVNRSRLQFFLRSSQIDMNDAAIFLSLRKSHRS